MRGINSRISFIPWNTWEETTQSLMETGLISTQEPPSNTYTFRGSINITHTVNDCIRDGKYAFLAIGDEVVVGVSKQANWASAVIPINTDWGVVNENHTPFHIYKISKKDIPKAVKFLKDIDKKIKKDIRKVAKQIAKDKRNGKFSNQPETKVLTF